MNDLLLSLGEIESDRTVTSSVGRFLLMIFYL